MQKDGFFSFLLSFPSVPLLPSLLFFLESGETQTWKETWVCGATGVAWWGWRAVGWDSEVWFLVPVVPWVDGIAFSKSHAFCGPRFPSPEKEKDQLGRRSGWSLPASVHYDSKKEGKWKSGELVGPTVVLLLAALFSGQQPPAPPQRNSVAPPCLGSVLQTTRGQPCADTMAPQSWSFSDDLTDFVAATLTLAHYSSPTGLAILERAKLISPQSLCPCYALYLGSCTCHVASMLLLILLRLPWSPNGRCQPRPLSYYYVFNLLYLGFVLLFFSVALITLWPKV